MVDYISSGFHFLSPQVVPQLLKQEHMDEIKSHLLVVPATLVVLFAVKWMFQSQKNDGATKKPLYRVDHSVLNIPLPLQSMWMNMGFWKV